MLLLCPISKAMLVYCDNISSSTSTSSGTGGPRQVHSFSRSDEAAIRRQHDKRASNGHFP
jgi:hypothetical protein